MATGTAGSQARRYHTSQIHYLTYDFTKADLAAATKIGTIPGGSLILSNISGVSVQTAFASQTADVLDLGNATVTEQFASDLTLTAAAFVEMDAAEGNMKVTVDTDIYALYTQTGTASTVGAATIVIAYLPDNG